MVISKAKLKVSQNVLPGPLPLGWGLSNAPADSSCSLMYSGHWARPWDIAGGGGPHGSKQGSVA